MSSWLSLSLPNPFKSDHSQNPTPPSPPDHADAAAAAGVQADLSDLGHTIGRHLHGVAAFLAPPPPPPSQPPPEVAESPSQAILGIKSDLVEIGGSFKSSLSLLSSTKAVSEISRFATNLLRFENDGVDEEGDEEEEEEEEEEEGEDGNEVAGVTDEVLDFVEEISSRPECWTDFPLSLDDDFNLSTAQKEHASTVERLVPSLADMRHTRTLPLVEAEDEAKSGDKIREPLTFSVEAREILLQNLRNKRNEPVEESEPINSSQEGTGVNNNQGEGRPSQDQEDLVEASSSQQRAEIDHENATSSDTKKQPENEEEISFSDLEDDENDENDLAGRLSRLRQARDERVPSPDGSSEWVRLGEHSRTQGAGGGGQKGGQSTSKGKDSSGEESNDWLTVDEGDLES
ncbi:hypothetical protein RHSIM_Rhsim01G0061000 [Rhododendron simsii]|uniref:BSD domain-containing protein n=1 Tax=Rhododendron simsii TaxID=118357 RepID=A0A834LVU9_RHOSS|nr:hypothetical protein RHSIM_Rhsim01G0061000 [Rhododendron simsii]